MEFFQVYNLIPSISSITGISPQRYLWRIVIALHISPRLIIAFVQKNFLRHHVSSKMQDQNQLIRANQLAKIVHYLNLIEICALAGVTYVSNKENYRELKSAKLWYKHHPRKRKKEQNFPFSASLPNSIRALLLIDLNPFSVHSYAWENIYRFHDHVADFNAGLFETPQDAVKRPGESSGATLDLLQKNVLRFVNCQHNWTNCLLSQASFAVPRFGLQLVCSLRVSHRLFEYGELLKFLQC